MTGLLPEQVETIRQLSRLWSDTAFVLIGANALALQVDLAWRQTNDLDLVLSVALADYPAGLAALAGWRQRPEGEHAWRSPTGVDVDVVPAGPDLLAAGSLIWPRSGFRMSLLGLRLAFEHNVTLHLGDSLSLRVAVTPVVVVLKLVAFLERPDAREHDLGDIAQVMECYLDVTDDRRWDLPVDFEDASAFALGTDIRTLIDKEERTAVEEFLEQARDDGHRTHALMIRNGPWVWRQHPKLLAERLMAFEKGLLG